MKDGAAPGTPASPDAGVLSFSREQAEQRALLQVENAALLSRVERLERFLRHDARTPLTLVLGHAQMLAEGLTPPERRGESFALISRQIQALSDRMETLGAAPPTLPSPEPRWVMVDAADAERVRALLGGLPAVVGTSVELSGLVDALGDRLIVVARGTPDLEVRALLNRL